MLKQEQQPEATAFTIKGMDTASHTPITPQELAHAITALEARKEAEAQKQVETASLANTIQHLGVDATPEELLAAVQAQREQHTKELKKKRMEKDARIGTFIFCMVLVAFLCPVIYGITHHRSHSKQTASSVTSASTLTPLAMAVEGQPVYVTFSDIVAIANGKSAQEVLAAPAVTSTASGTRQWTILKFRDHYFVRGWRYRTDGDNKEYADWLSSAPRNASDEETGETPVERFKFINKPPSIADDSAQQGEQIKLPDLTSE